MSQKYADIIIDISHEAIDRTFQYAIPKALEDEIDIGVLVTVPFGQGNRTRKGYVINITEEPVYDVDRIKEISGVANHGLQIEGKLIKLADWMRRTYGSTMNHALRTVMPVKESVRNMAVRNAAPEYEISHPPVVELSDGQQSLVDEFKRDFDEGKRPTYLLHGITGSGKTEVYIGCIKKVVDEGKQAIVLIPEIGLTYQSVARFRQHFGERVAVINSKQSKGEKYREFMRAKKHEVDVIIGPRSALFTPCDKLGLIVIDEEHDGAYKSEQIPKYHARETAVERARLESASVILGSATPSLESYTMAKLGRYRLWELEERPSEATLSEVSIVDMRRELRLGNRSMISAGLGELIEDRLNKKEQILLFMNRRGYNSFVSCRECGTAIRCPKCDVSLALHNNGYMTCHYCGYTEPAPKVCPACSSKLIGGFGAGTQRIEEEVKRLFPEARVLRMDKDTTTRKNAAGEIISGFANYEADILIGTQMIVKGHDISNVTLVGVILADTSLHVNDFRASERTFDLLTQAAGRAGRGSKKGHVLIQTYQPDHYAIVTAAKQAYREFYDTEIMYRRLMKYPPVYNMGLVMLMSGDYEAAVRASEEVAAMLTGAATKEDRIIGPSDAGILKINDIYRRVIYIKSGNPENLSTMLVGLEDYTAENVSISVDINPMNIC